MKSISVIFACFLFIISACNPQDLISEFGSAIVTAKSKVGEVLNTAKIDFSQDAKLAGIYGFNVNSEGQVDLQKPTENAFVYIAQSDSMRMNEFYVPVYKSSPVQSPINFNNMLSVIRDTQARNTLELVFGNLSTVNIDASANYDDSPMALGKVLENPEVATFRINNPEAKIDMILLPSKALDGNSGEDNYADWIVNLYSDTSLVMWLNTESGIILNLNNL